MRWYACGAVLLSVFSSLGAVSDPYSALSPEQTALLKPVIERYVRDQTKQDWSDLWNIQDQTSDLKNELLLGNRVAPDLGKQQFISAMRETIGTGYPRLRSFELREVRHDGENFIMLGCGLATRETWKQKGIVVAGIRIVTGQPKIELFRMTSNPC